MKEPAESSQRNRGPGSQAAQWRTGIQDPLLQLSFPAWDASAHRTFRPLCAGDDP